MPRATAYEIAGDAISRLTFDVRAAFENITDNDSRAYAFGLAHLLRDLTELLTYAAWVGTESAAHRVIDRLQRQAQMQPDSVPDWVRALAPRWPTR